MKLIATLPLALMIGIAASSSMGDGGLLVAAETNAPPATVGVYDSRAVAYAHFWSDAYGRILTLPP